MDVRDVGHATLSRYGAMTRSCRSSRAKWRISRLLIRLRARAKRSASMATSSPNLFRYFGTINYRARDAVDANGNAIDGARPVRDGGVQVQILSPRPLIFVEYVRHELPIEVAFWCGVGVLILGMLCAGRMIAPAGPFAFAGGRPFVSPDRLGYGFGAWKLISIVSRN